MTDQGAGGGDSREDEGGTPAIPDEVWARFAHDTERAIARSAPREPSARERADGARIEPQAGGSGASRPEASRGEVSGPEVSGPGSGGSRAGGSDPGTSAADGPFGEGTRRPRADPTRAGRHGSERSASPGLARTGPWVVRRSRRETADEWGGHPADEAVGELWQPEERPAGPLWRDLDARARRRRVARLLGAATAVVLLWTVASRAPLGSREGYGTEDTTVEQSEDAPLRVPATPGPTPAVSPTDATPARHVG
ncbi:hypothetical protein [Streptomyces griseoaurantiacus]|uniref:hypothetical protein n=1 Tax=Streptomyces griseoaurantiacus TaxID=68213 RepID=UPI00368DEB29